MRNKKGQFIKGHNESAGDKNPMWKGGRIIDEKGYIRISVGKKRYRYEHRIIVESKLRYKLKKNETIHHKNGIRNDSRPENLIIISRKSHGSIHGKESILSPLHPNNLQMGRI